MTKLEEVFKTSGTPTHTFVKPVEYDDLLLALRTPGRGVVIEGPSGIGKSTAVTKALADIGHVGDVARLSARKKQDIPAICALPDKVSCGSVVIDDFHKLCDRTKATIADLMKVIADEERTDSKIVIVGINRAGESLIRFAPDLNNRLSIVSLEANPPEKVEELITKGERALNIRLNVKAEIVSNAQGSFYIAQMLSQGACLEAGIHSAQVMPRTPGVSFEAVRGKVFDTLSRNFLARTETFVRGTRFRREGRAPYLHLLYWLAQSDAWSLDIQHAIDRNPNLTGSVTQIVEQGYLQKLIESNDELRAVLHYDERARLLTVEDPQYVYFLRTLPWSKFVREVGFLSVTFPRRYDVALSFAGADRVYAERIFSKLSEREIEVFYDQNEQHRILASNVEDYLRPIYQSDAEFVVVLLGKDYPTKVWTRFESDQFQARFETGAVIPIWFSDVSESAFDGTRRIGGALWQKTSPLDEEAERIVRLIAHKIEESRAAKGRGTSRGFTGPPARTEYIRPGPEEGR